MLDSRGFQNKISASFVYIISAFRNRQRYDFNFGMSYFMNNGIRVFHSPDQFFERTDFVSYIPIVPATDSESIEIVLLFQCAVKGFVSG